MACYDEFSKSLRVTVSGKFDQLRRSVPYGGFLPAFRELVDQLLAEDASSLERWREEIPSPL